MADAQCVLGVRKLRRVFQIAGFGIFLVLILYRSFHYDHENLQQQIWDEEGRDGGVAIGTRKLLSETDDGIDEDGPVSVTIN